MKILYKKFIESLSLKLIKSYCKYRILKKIPDLENFIEKSISTGASYIDYYTIYSMIIKRKYRVILECGSGVTTYIICKALEELEQKHNITGVKCVTLEEIDKYQKNLIEIFPDSLRKKVEFVLSKRCEKKYEFLTGVGYEKIPKLSYDFVLIDGPNSISPSDGIKKFNFDFIEVILNNDSNKSVDLIIDKRINTVLAYKMLFGKKIKYNKFLTLGFGTNVTKSDLLKNNKSKLYEK